MFFHEQRFKSANLQRDTVRQSDGRTFPVVRLLFQRRPNSDVLPGAACEDVFPLLSHIDSAVTAPRSDDVGPSLVPAIAVLARPLGNSDSVSADAYQIGKRRKSSLSYCSGWVAVQQPEGSDACRERLLLQLVRVRPAGGNAVRIPPCCLRLSPTVYVSSTTEAQDIVTGYVRASSFDASVDLVNAAKKPENARRYLARVRSPVHMRSNSISIA
jgi:hypothetical protein